MSDDRFEITEGREVVRHTIVGGRPMARRKKTLKIPIGIEKVLARAAGDDGFRKALLADRKGALEAAGYLMIDSELELLTGIPDALLNGMIRRIDLKEHGKRKFLRGVTAAVFSAAALTALPECEMGGSGGMNPDDVMEALAEPGDEVDVSDVSRGVEPDEIESLPPEVSAGVDFGQEGLPPPDEIEEESAPVELGETADEPADVIETEVYQGDGGINLYDVTEPAPETTPQPVTPAK
jgi:hypothetical protein